MHCFSLSSDYVEVIFYEMMAFLTALRSSLDALVRIMKFLPSVRNEIGNERSFHVLMKKLKNRKDYPLPPFLKELIERNRDWLTKAIDYRDCLLHCEMLSQSVFPNLFVFHSEDELIALQTWLPDNPSANSTRLFKFENRIEYLSYAYVTYIHILDFVGEVSNYVLQELQK